MHVGPRRWRVDAAQDTVMSKCRRSDKEAMKPNKATPRAPASGRIVCVAAPGRVAPSDIHAIAEQREGGMELDTTEKLQRSIDALMARIDEQRMTLGSLVRDTAPWSWRLQRVPSSRPLLHR